MAHERGLKFTVGIWDHIYRGGVQGGGIPGADEATPKPSPGLVWGVTGENLVPYTKAALASFVKLVPEVDAIQFRMHDESGLKNSEQEAFWRDVFLMMRETAPKLRFDLRAKGLPDSVIRSRYRRRSAVPHHDQVLDGADGPAVPSDAHQHARTSSTAATATRICCAIRSATRCTGGSGTAARRACSCGATRTTRGASRRALTSTTATASRSTSRFARRWRPSRTT